MAVRSHLELNAFPPEKVAAMAEAFREACDLLKISIGEPSRRDNVAHLILILARADGDADAIDLRDRAVKILSYPAAPPH